MWDNAERKWDVVDIRKKHRVLVVGAGASGMAAALVLAQKGIDVALLEANDMPGKKILATGNGKCNFTNDFQSPECYRGECPEVAVELLKRYGPACVLRFFEGLGILAKQRNGYYYPNTEQAATVRDAFALRLAEQKVPLYLNTHVDRIKKEGVFVLTASHRTKVDGKRDGGKKPKKPVFSGSRTVFFEARYVILATGGCAGNISGADGSGYALMEGFGHRIVPVVPALVQLKLVPNGQEALSGLRTQARLLLRITGRDGDRREWQERGEVLFTDYGLSGIPAMQVSRFVAQELAKGKQRGKIEVLLDFFPDTSENNLRRMLLSRFAAFPHRDFKSLLLGMLPTALNAAILAAEGLLAGGDPGGHKNGMAWCAGVLAHRMKHFSREVDGTNGFEHAQAAAGGAALDEFFSRTMESKLTEGLFVAGELADIDGSCGGYNLQWAWMSAFAAAEAIAGREGR